MALQWKRQVSLLVLRPQTANADLEDTGADQTGFDLSQMHIKFAIRQSDVETPNTAVIRVYNLKQETVGQIQSLSGPLTASGGRVILQAGYEDLTDFGVIFDGLIKQVRVGRENATDTYLEILAADGDNAIRLSLVNRSLAAGSKVADRLNVAQQALAQHGVTQGYVPALPSVGLPRGKVLFGLARALARNEADNAGCRWSILNGKFQLIPLTSYAPDQAVVLTSKTGMIGLPEQTQDGIHVRALLNPNLKIGRRVQIDNKSIQQQPIDLRYTAINYFPSIATDGFYRVMVSEHSGDTRGEEFYTDMTCLQIDPSAPVTNSVKAAG